jgi:tetratricopeptide (TPR) repeat protein
MTARQAAAENIPTREDVQDAFARLIASEEFRASPQLVRFLRFVTEAALDGHAARITSYAIAVDALGRGAQFDPQSDPIVRVEATRLRRAIERYYAGSGAHDPVLILLPRGSYVPTFAFRASEEGGGLSQNVPGQASGRPWARFARPRWAIAGVAAAAVGVAIASAPLWRARVISSPVAPTSPATKWESAGLRPGNGMPSLALRLFDSVGAVPPAAAIEATGLRERLTDALSRFDSLNVHVARQPAVQPTDHIADYQLFGFIEYLEDGAAVPRFRLVDTGADTVVWTRSFDPVAPSSSREAAEEAIVQHLASTLLLGFGVIRAHEFAKGQATTTQDPRYRCLLTTYEAFRSFESLAHDRARACLEELTAIDTNFSAGFAYLAFLHIREYLFGLGSKVDDRTALDRALRVARRSVEANPASARAYHSLALTLVYRHDFASGFMAFERAIGLNKYDVSIRSAFGDALIQSGYIDRGMKMVKEAEDYNLVRPIWEHFNLFLGHYMRGDLVEATHEADQVTSDSLSYGLLARALMAGHNGDHHRAGELLDRLETRFPAWRGAPRREIAKYIPASEIADRLTADLAALRSRVKEREAKP